MTTPTQVQKRLRWIADQRNNENADMDEICTAADRALDEVGEQSAEEIIEPVIRAQMNKAINATIERCAQVAENTAEPGQWGIDRGAEIASAIRKLKAEP